MKRRTQKTLMGITAAVIIIGLILSIVLPLASLIK